VARVSKTSVCGSFGAVSGPLRYFADRYGTTHAGIEGTQVPLELLQKHARRNESELAYDSLHMSLVLDWRMEHSGFELESETEVLRAWGPELADRARRVLAEALAREEAQHPAVRRNHPEIEEVREVWRRSGGRTAKLGERELIALYEAQLEGVSTMDEFHARPLELDLAALVPPEAREAFLALPGAVSIRDREVDLRYEVEQDEAGKQTGVVRLQLPEKLARTLVEEELPVLDRPLRFMVSRGRRGNLRADTLLELQELLDMPWMPDEIAPSGEGGREGGSRRPTVRHGRDQRKAGAAPRRPGPHGAKKSGGPGGPRGGGRSGGARHGAAGGGRTAGGRPGRGGPKGKGRGTRRPKR
jgi:hypothetical protein